MERLRSKLDKRPATQQLTTFVAILLLAVLDSAALAQQAASAPATPAGRPLAEVIDEYVREGLASNLSLQAQSLEVEGAQSALDAARARYYPEVGLAARYSKSQG